MAVAEAARNLTCSGAKPARPDGLPEFWQPIQAGNFWQLREAIEGIAEHAGHFERL